MTERDLQRKLVEMLKQFAWSYCHTRPIQDVDGRWVTSTTAKGWPDLICLRAEFVVAIEVKGVRTKFRPGQVEWLRRFAAVGGGRAWCVRPADDLNDVARWLAFPRTSPKLYGLPA